MMLKDSARFARLTTQALLGLFVVESQFLRVAGVGARLTSGSDSEHKGRPVAGEDKDPHYTGRAVDIGVKNVDPKIRGTLVEAIGEALGTQYTLLWESKGTPNEHFHLQYEGPA